MITFRQQILNNILTTNLSTTCTFLFLHVKIEEEKKKPTITSNLRREIGPGGHIFEPITGENRKTLTKISLEVVE